MNIYEKEGLYDPSNEHDACGVGMLVNIHGGKSHQIVESALKILENMRHRGAEGADNKYMGSLVNSKCFFKKSEKTSETTLI